MNITKLQYEPKYQALEVYLSGCKPPHCHGCHNESLWSFNQGEPWKKYKRKLHQHMSADIVKRAWILGGCPMDQDHQQLELFLSFLSQFKKEVWIWTRYRIEQTPNNILQYCDYVKTGEYRQELDSYEEPLFGIKLASLNQEIIDVRRTLENV